MHARQGGHNREKSDEPRGRMSFSRLSSTAQGTSILHRHGLFSVPKKLPNTVSTSNISASGPRKREMVHTNDSVVDNLENHLLAGYDDRVGFLIKFHSAKKRLQSCSSQSKFRHPRGPRTHKNKTLTKISFPTYHHKLELRHLRPPHMRLQLPLHHPRPRPRPRPPRLHLQDSIPLPIYPGRRAAAPTCSTVQQNSINQGIQGKRNLFNFRVHLRHVKKDVFFVRFTIFRACGAEKSRPEQRASHQSSQQYVPHPILLCFLPATTAHSHTATKRGVFKQKEPTGLRK